jgi:hypothetical protein
MTINLDGWNRVRARVTDMGRATLRVGVVGEAAHRTHSRSNLSLGILAIIHELGNPRTGLAARSFVMSTLELPDVQAHIVDMERRLLPEVMFGRMSRDVALAEIGEYVAERIRARMLNGEIRPDIMPSTIAAKGGDDRALVATHELVEGVGFEIVR